MAKGRLAIVKIGIVSRSFQISPFVVALGLALASSFALGLPSSGQIVLTEFAIYFMWISLAVGWNLIGGYAGLLNLGFAGFFAMGSAVGYEVLRAGSSILSAFVLAGAAGVVLGIILVPTFRLRSDYFAIGTLVVPFILQPVFTFLVGSNFVLPAGDTPSPFTLYFIGVAFASLSIFATYFLMRSKVGLALRAIGNDERASASVGINILFYKTIAVVVGAFIASVSGAYYLYYLGTVSSTAFEDLSFSLFPIFMVIIGGIATFEGPIIGALIFSGITYAGATLFPGTTFDTPLFALIIMVVAVLLPRGIGPAAKKLLLWLFHFLSFRFFPH